jgi:hypothetical protein
MKYLEFRKKLKLLGLTVKEFMEINNLHQNSAGNWRTKGFVPDLVINFLEVLEKLSLEEREKFFTEKLGEK